MKRIIALFGHANCGKTATLNYLREMIRSNGVISNFDCSIFGKVKCPVFGK